MRKFLPVIAAALLLTAIPAPASALSLSASSAILVDGDSGRVLYEHRADERCLIASTTKLMTALVAAEQLKDLSETVTVRREWLGSEGSSIYLTEGEEITAEALLWGLLLESGNDAAMVLACSCAGSVESFAGLMNEKAAELGMKDSSFANPSGLDADGHYSTARDMARLAAACLENETVSTICAMKSVTAGSRTFVNHNRLLTMYEGCVGMKTGYTRRAGRTLVSAARRDGRTLIAVTLNAPDDWNDHMELFDYGFSSWSEGEGCAAGEEVTILPVSGALVPLVPVVTAEAFSWPLKDGETLRAEAECASCLKAPLSEGDVVGRLVFYQGEEPVGQVALLAGRDVRRDAVEEQTPLQRILSAILGETVTVYGADTE